MGRLRTLEKEMTETFDPETIQEAMALIDRGLGDIQHRELITTSEVADLLLDVRLLLSTVEVAEDANADADPDKVPVTN
jgi:hypothetical protein